MSRVQLPDGGEAIIADFALESTAQMMLAQLAQLNGNKDWKLLVTTLKIMQKIKKHSTNPHSNIRKNY